MIQLEMDFDGPDIQDRHDAPGVPDCRFPPGSCGLFGFVKSAIKGIGKGVKAVGKVAQKAAPLAAFVPGLGTVASLGLGALGKLGGDTPGGSAPGEFGPGFADPGGGGGFWSGIGGAIKGGFNFLGGGDTGKGVARLGGLALGGLSIKAAADQRKSQEEFNQKLLDVQQKQLVRAEVEFDRKAPLREGGQAAILQAIRQQSSSKDPFSEFLKSSKTRRPGEFSKRGAPAPVAGAGAA